MNTETIGNIVINESAQVQFDPPVWDLLADLKAAAKRCRELDPNKRYGRASVAVTDTAGAQPDETWFVHVGERMISAKSLVHCLAEAEATRHEWKHRVAELRKQADELEAKMQLEEVGS